ncbi:hypothetical protein [Terrisporobacter glycolicus]|uniref:Uncharacterized protein n=1 Tax=Terrisporobacter glycolicus ATCC 14880 = DSM 1288 TaxID=1121315 RepID=A0ABZ2EXB4_9FIRM|nr:hypothetical protein [Terrisporobacter glycolicus]
MLTVRKQNKELTILDSQKESFLDLGYSVIDKEGNVTEVGKATELGNLKEENETLKTEVAKLKDKVKKLQNENKKLKEEKEANKE